MRPPTCPAFFAPAKGLRRPSYYSQAHFFAVWFGRWLDSAKPLMRPNQQLSRPRKDRLCDKTTPVDVIAFRVVRINRVVIPFHLTFFLPAPNDQPAWLSSIAFRFAEEFDHGGVAMVEEEARTGVELPDRVHIFLR